MVSKGQMISPALGPAPDAAIMGSGTFWANALIWLLLVYAVVGWAVMPAVRTRSVIKTELRPVRLLEDIHIINPAEDVDIPLLFGLWTRSGLWRRGGSG